MNILPPPPPPIQNIKDPPSPLTTSKCCSQGLSQDLETGCPKLAVVKFLGVQIFKGDRNYTQISTINMYKFIKISHYILIQCHGNYVEMKKINDMLETDTLKKILAIFFGCSEGCFLRVCASKKTPGRPAGLDNGCSTWLGDNVSAGSRNLHRDPIFHPLMLTASKAA